MTFSYWWPFLWVFLVGAICLFFNFTRTEPSFDGRTVVRWRWIPAIVLLLPLVLMAAFRPLDFGDSGVYRAGYIAAPSSLSSFGSYVGSQAKDPGYAVLVILFKSLISQNYQLFFLLVASIQGICLLLTFRKCSTDYWFSIFLFVASADYLSWMHNGTRQFIAVTLVFAALPLLIKKKYLWVALIIAIATAFHLSALLCVPILFMALGKPWNWKTFVFLFAVIIIVFFVDRFTNFLAELMEDTQYSAEVQELKTSVGTNILRVLFYSVPTIAAFVFRKRIETAQNKTINICVNLSVASMGLYIISYFTSGMLIGRLPIYFSLANYILLPWMIEEIFERRSAKLVKVVFILVYSVFFYYQVGITWGFL